MNILEQMEQQKDVFQTIESVKGKQYAAFVRHSYCTAALMRTVDPLTAQIVAMITGAMLTDLAKEYGMDLNDSAFTDSVIKDVQSLGIDLDVKARA